MNILTGINNFLELVNENWTAIMVTIGLAIAAINKIQKYLSLTTDEKIEIAKTQIREVLLKLITDAECNFAEWEKSGSIKRSQVIEDIFTKYPILSKAVDQAEIIEWIDTEIDNSLVTLRDIIETNKF